MPPAERKRNRLGLLFVDADWKIIVNAIQILDRDVRDWAERLIVTRAREVAETNPGRVV